MHARRQSFPAFADIAPAVQEIWPWGEVASVEEIAGRFGQKFPTLLVEAAIWKIVGDSARPAKATKCTFSGVVPIELQVFQSSGIRLVECPDCARTRSLYPRNVVLRFPSHEKRKAHTPNTEQQWIMGKTNWDVVSG